jgi:hypothetical protein
MLLELWRSAFSLNSLRRLSLAKTSVSPRRLRALDPKLPSFPFHSYSDPIYDSAGTLVLDPDESVVASIHLLFQQFKTLGSAYGVLRFFAHQQLPFPRRLWAPRTNGRLHWGPLSLSRLLAILHNPTYTGAYVYGRRRSQPVVVAGQVVRVRTLQRPTDQWTVVLQGTHAAYLSWEEYMENQRQLTRNRTDLASEGRRGAPREGTALLPGLLLCGRCGRRMTVRYHGPGGHRAAYQCGPNIAKLS